MFYRCENQITNSRNNYVDLTIRTCFSKNLNVDSYTLKKYETNILLGQFVKKIYIKKILQKDLH